MSSFKGKVFVVAGVTGLKSRAGASYTFVSGGLSHGVFAPPFW